MKRLGHAIMRMLGYRQVRVMLGFRPTHVSLMRDGSFSTGGEYTHSYTEWKFVGWRRHDP